MNRLTIILMISVFILALSLCAFFYGYQLCISYIKESQEIGLVTFIIAFFSAIISSIFIARCKIKLDILIDYGIPVYYAAEHVKEIIHNTNKNGINELKGIIEKSMKDQLKDIVKKGK